MNDLLNVPSSVSTLTMTSLAIAELVGKRHDNVRRTVEMLSEKGVIARPQIEIVEDKQSLSPNNKTKVYNLDKRSSLVVVAQLSPEFTAAVIDRWQELEAKEASPAPAPAPVLTPAPAPPKVQMTSAAYQLADAKLNYREAGVKVTLAEIAVEREDLKMSTLPPPQMGEPMIAPMFNKEARSREWVLQERARLQAEVDAKFPIKNVKGLV